MITFRWTITALLAGASLYPVLSHRSFYPFLPYSMFTVDRLRGVYYLPVATLSDGSEYLISRRAELYPYRLTGGVDLQERIDGGLPHRQMQELLTSWCLRVPKCKAATLYRYGEVFRHGRLDLNTPRQAIVSTANE